MTPLKYSLLALAGLLLTSACVPNVGRPTTRLGMVEDPETGFLFGSAIERNLVTDASFFSNRKIKIKIRNTSGDLAFDLDGFSSRLENAFAAKGYEPTDDDDFGLLVDVNVMYSGHAQSNLANEYGFLGGAAGGIAGYRSGAEAGTAIGALAGATFGSVVGSFITDDTYVIVSSVTFGEIRDTRKKGSAKTITFSRSVRPYEDDEDEDDRRRRGFKETHSTRISVFAGGRNVSRRDIADGVRQRMIRIVSDFI